MEKGSLMLDVYMGYENEMSDTGSVLQMWMEGPGC